MIIPNTEINDANGFYHRFMSSPISNSLRALTIQNPFVSFNLGLGIQFLIFLLMIFVSSVSRGSDKVHITSDNLTLNKKNLSATFEDNVRIIFEDQTVYTDKLIIYYSDLGPKREIIKIVFPTKIKAIKGCKNDVILADGGEFDNLAKKLTLTGNVQMQKDNNILVTDKMVYSAKLKSVESKTNAK